MDANSGEPWSEMDITDLKHSVAYGDTPSETASFLCRDEDEVRAKDEGAWAATGQAPRPLAGRSSIFRRRGPHAGPAQRVLMVIFIGAR